MLNSRLLPGGGVSIMVPVGVVQSGCTVVMLRGPGCAAGAALTVTMVALEIQPVAVLLTVTG